MPAISYATLLVVFMVGGVFGAAGLLIARKIYWRLKNGRLNFKIRAPRRRVRFRRARHKLAAFDRVFRSSLRSSRIERLFETLDASTPD